MKSAAKPINEEKRLESLKELKISDTEIEKSYDDITKLIAEICEVPISLVSLIDENRQWFKSHHGIDANETPREYAFCAHAILQDGIFEINDSRKDERFSDNPLVTDDPNVIFYAGIPLKTPDDHALGTLCVIDHRPKDLNEFQKNALKVLGQQVSNMFELRRNLNRLATAKSKEVALAMAVTYAHEVNNPLTVAMANLEMVQKHIEPLRFKKIKNSLLRVSDIVKDIAHTFEQEEFELESYSDDVSMIKVKKSS